MLYESTLHPLNPEAPALNPTGGVKVKPPLGGLEFRKDPNFGFEVPVAVPGVDSAILDPRSTWADKDEYDRTAGKLVDLFCDNFAQFEEYVDDGVKQCQPQVAAA